jgi:MFS transporter, FLVCR family, MFS-domain-containing protein 7
MAISSLHLGLKSCIKNRQYLILTLVVGGGIGLSNSLFTLMQQLLCPYGYNNTFSGYAAALIIVGGIVGGFLSGKAFVSVTLFL